MAVLVSVSQIMNELFVKDYVFPNNSTYCSSCCKSLAPNDVSARYKRLYGTPHKNAYFIKGYLHLKQHCYCYACALGVAKKLRSTSSEELKKMCLTFPKTGYCDGAMLVLKALIQKGG